MKNFLLAVALLSIGTAGTAVAAGSDNLSLTAKAAKVKQIITEYCHENSEDNSDKSGLYEDLKLNPEQFTKKMCECQGRKFENHVRKGLEVPLDVSGFTSLYNKYVTECFVAVRHRKH